MGVSECDRDGRLVVEQVSVIPSRTVGAALDLSATESRPPSPPSTLILPGLIPWVTPESPKATFDSVTLFESARFYAHSRIVRVLDLNKSTDGEGARDGHMCAELSRDRLDRVIRTFL